MIAFIQTFCLVPEGPLVGKPIKLNRAQRRFILAVYDNPKGTRKAIFSVGRKNGKTTLMACIVLGHLVGPEARKNSQICSGALSKDQAAKLFDLAHKMIIQHPKLRKIIQCVPSKKYLKGIPWNTEYMALAADGKTNMGGSPILAVLDETGQVVGSKNLFIDSIVTSQGAHDDPLLIVISTQAPNDADLLSIWIDDAETGDDPQTICHCYTAPADADLLDEETWKMANPALGDFKNLDDMKRMANEAVRMPSFENSFRNLYLNQRVALNSPFISRNAWNLCAGPTPPIALCEEIYGGLDLSKRTDLTALALLGLYQGIWHAYIFIWTPEKGLHERARRDRMPYDAWVKAGWMHTTPGATVGYDFVAEQISEIIGPLGDRFISLAFDRWRMDVMKKEFERIGFEPEMVDWGQGFKDMSVALDFIEGKILDQALRHPENPALTMAAANSIVVQDAAGGRKLDKSKTSARIDPMQALCMAGGIASRTFDGRRNINAFLADPIIL